MKKLLLLAFTAVSSVVSAQDDTLYIMKDGFIVNHLHHTFDMDSMKVISTPDDSLNIYKDGSVAFKYSTLNDIDSIIFYAPEEPPVDADGNIYTTVNVNGTIWMVENLKTTKYNDGTPILKIENDAEWMEQSNNLKNPAYSWYDDDSATYCNPYGALYNSYAVETNKLCPSGWHVSTEEEWSDLRDYLFYGSVGKKTMDASGAYWKDSPFSTPNNVTGLTFLPGGHRRAEGNFEWLTEKGYYIGNRDSDISLHLAILNYDDDGETYSNTNKAFGYSVRCVKD